MFRVEVFRDVARSARVVRAALSPGIPSLDPRIGFTGASYGILLIPNRYASRGRRNEGDDSLQDVDEQRRDFCLCF